MESGFYCAKCRLRMKVIYIGSRPSSCQSSSSVADDRIEDRRTEHTQEACDVAEQPCSDSHVLQSSPRAVRPAFALMRAALEIAEGAIRHQLLLINGGECHDVIKRAIAAAKAIESSVGEPSDGEP